MQGRCVHSSGISTSNLQLTSEAIARSGDVRCVGKRKGHGLEASACLSGSRNHQCNHDASTQVVGLSPLGLSDSFLLDEPAGTCSWGQSMWVSIEGAEKRRAVCEGIMPAFSTT